MGDLYEIATTGAETSVVNSTNIIEVSQASDLPATLVANTTYIIRGTISTNTPISVTNQGCSIIGSDRNKDKLVWTGLTGTTMLTITDVDFDLEGVWLSSTITGSVLIAADNYDGAVYNSGRSKVLTITNCQFRNCFDVASIEGFDLVDISNTLFFYVQAPNFGLKFLNTSKIEITSCELIRWFDETSIPTPSGYSTASMIEILANGGGSGVGAVNISGCIIHPQQTQNGINLNGGSTTAFGTIAANTFVIAGLTGGRIFLANGQSTVTGGYSEAEALTYDVFSNQGLPNSTSYGGFYTGAASGHDTPTSPGGWFQVAYLSTPTASNEQRFTFTSPSVPITGGIGTAPGGIVTYDGTKTIFVTITCTVVYNDTGGGNNAFEFGIAKNKTSPTFTPEAPSVLSLLIGGGAYNAATIVYTDTIVNGDDFQLVVQNISSGDDIEIISTQFLIKE